MSFVTTDVEEAQALTGRFFYKSRAEPVAGTRLAYRYELVVSSMGPLNCGILSHGCEVAGRFRGFENSYGLIIPLKGNFPVQYRNDEGIIASPSTAALHTPTTDLAIRGYPTGTERLFLLSFNRDALDDQLRKLIGRDHTQTIKLTNSLDLRKGRGGQWWQVASTLALGLQSPDSLVRNPLMTAHLSDVVMSGFLLATDHPYREALDAWVHPMRSRAIRKAMDIIETHAHKPLTIPDIAAEVGCSVRTLQVGFRNHLDMTPHEYLVRVRLDRAHALLRDANPAMTTVAEVAALCGFSHSGRFAAEYHKLYNEPPYSTLRDR